MEGRDIWRLSLAALSAAVLAGCSHTPPAPAQPQSASPGLAVFDQALTLPAVASSVVREGDQVAYLVSRPGTGDQPDALVARFSASCTEPQGQMMYPTAGGMAYLTAQPRTLDDDSQLPPRQLDALRASPQLHQACADNPRPDWRKVSGGPARQWLLLDAASARRVGRETVFWGAYDYPREQLDDQRSGYYVQRRERFAVDCAQQSFRRLSAFYVDADNGVGAGQVLLETKARALRDATPDERLLMQKVCTAPASLAALPRFAGRIKAPATMPVPAVAAPVAEAVQNLALAPAPKTLNRLGLKFDATVLKRKIADNTGAQWFFSTDPATGQMVIQKRGLTAAGNIEVSFRGLIPLAAAFSESTDQGPQARLVALTYLRFEGDWQNLPVGGTVSYTRAYEPLVDGKPRITDLITLYCSVDSQQPASAINPALQGMAKQVTCKGDNERATGVGHYAYLSTYGLFFPLRTVDQVSDWVWRIETVE